MRVVAGLLIGATCLGVGLLSTNHGGLSNSISAGVENAVNKLQSIHRFTSSTDDESNREAYLYLEEDSLEDKSSFHGGVQKSGLRRMVHRVDNIGTSKDQATEFRLIRKMKAHQNDYYHARDEESQQREDDSVTYREEPYYWGRALQQSMSHSMSHSMSYSMSLSMSYSFSSNRFSQNNYPPNRFGNSYNLRNEVEEGISYNCSCNDRYTSWQEFRTGSRRLERIIPLDGPLNEMEKSPPTKHKLDFIIAGFPKCGTTTLMYAFNAHDETSIKNTERCSITDKQISDDHVYLELNKALLALGSDTQKRGIKCPTGLKNFQSMERLENHSPNARILIGVRHPVDFFQSFYNYRVTEIYNKGLHKSNIPSPRDLVGSQEWMGVSTDNARFEVFLMQLGKTGITMSDMSLLASRPGMAVKPFPFKVFLYSLEQLQDDNKERSTRFRRDMQQFLELDKPLDVFGRENENRFVGENAHPETIDICNDEFEEVRAILLSQATRTKEWIRNQFLESSDVFVGDEKHFLELLDTWGADPCDARGERLREETE